MTQNLQAAEKIFKKYNPEYPFEYKFIDQEYAAKFEDTQRIGTLIGLFASLTILLFRVSDYSGLQHVHGGKPDQRNWC